MKRRQLNRFAAALALGLAAAPLAHAQDKPMMRILVGFPPGGSVDIVARLLAEHMKTTLDQNVIVDNKPGAAGRVALGEIKRAAPDGNTLVLAPSGALVILPWLYKNVGYDPIKDFTPIARVTTFDFAVTAGPAAPAGDLKAVLAWLKANPGKANYATSGAGTVPHFAGQLLAQETGIPLTHVAYKGGALAAQDLLGGQVPIMIDTASETIEHHKAGKLRILAISGETRSAVLPDVPTLKEQGVNVVADAFFGLYGPAGMPADRVQKISDAVAKALATPEVQAKIRAVALTPSYASSQSLATTQAAHLKRWEAPIKASGYTVEQ
ncbi:MAG TPA: Bug family tripartite tricarboxylate transporter substrate binding protein [Caldimonas sp.]|nr:Bug family tripartite tricarboxylate transporter substrate binding protein [Caldimonas sp.]HEX2542368.1 Bug family tripartite tricarboxylate transporter substrate binding protein [Caldimonas sp.]